MNKGQAVLVAIIGWICTGVGIWAVFSARTDLWITIAVVVTLIGCIGIVPTWGAVIISQRIKEK